MKTNNPKTTLLVAALLMAAGLAALPASSAQADPVVGRISEMTGPSTTSGRALVDYTVCVWDDPDNPEPCHDRHCRKDPSMCQHTAGVNRVLNAGSDGKNAAEDGDFEEALCVAIVLILVPSPVAPLAALACVMIDKAGEATRETTGPVKAMLPQIPCDLLPTGPWDPNGPDLRCPRPIQNAIDEASLEVVPQLP